MKTDDKPVFKIQFAHDGKLCTAKATRLNDAFWEITGGKYNGYLIHVNDILDFKPYESKD